MATDDRDDDEKPASEPIASAAADEWVDDDSTVIDAPPELSSPATSAEETPELSESANSVELTETSIPVDEALMDDSGFDWQGKTPFMPQPAFDPDAKASSPEAVTQIEAAGVPRLPDTNDGVPVVGTELSGYELLSIIHAGSSTVIYEAKKAGVDGNVAIKLLRPQYAINPAAVRRYFSEAKSINEIGHESIVGISEFFEHENGFSYCVMELLQGKTLAETTEAIERLPSEHILNIMIQVCDALGAAHDVGVVHCDLKPVKIFLAKQGDRKNVVKLLDFGMAKLFDDATNDLHDMTSIGTLMGTPRYMAPEQVGGFSVDHRTDIYGVGLILYELLTGKKLFQGRSVSAILDKVAAEIPPSPSSVAGPGTIIPQQLDELIIKALEKSPAMRPQSIDEVADQLRSIASRRQRHSISTTNPFIAPVPANYKQPRPWLGALVAFMATVVIGSLLIVFARPWDQPAVNDNDPGIEVVAPSVDPTMEIAFDSTPPGATVVLVPSDEVFGITPFKRALEQIDEAQMIEFRLPGFDVSRVELNADTGERVHATLQEVGEP